MGEIRDGVRGFGKGSILCRVCGGDCECCEGREDVWLVRDFWDSTYTCTSYTESLITQQQNV